MSVFLSALAYGLLSLDHFTVGPFLLSRPLVVGSVVGFLCGHAGEGVALGLLAECLWVRVPPVGAGQWDVGLSVALAGVWAFELPHDVLVPGARIALAFTLALPFAVVGRSADQWVRRHTRLLAVRALAGVERGLVGPLRYSLIFGAVLWVLKSLVAKMYLQEKRNCYAIVRVTYHTSSFVFLPLNKILPLQNNKTLQEINTIFI